MATHETPASMLKESLPELLEAATLCCAYRKSDSKWGQYKGEGCLGYPGGILLFSIIDSIGSYFRKDGTLKIKVDSKDSTIDDDGWEHFKILNSKYFNQSLSENFIKALYSKFRSLLTHNSVLGKNAIMIPNNASFSNSEIKGQAFFLGKNQEDGSEAYMISLEELLDLCKIAVDEFKKDIDKVVPVSKQGKKFV